MDSKQPDNIDLLCINTIRTLSMDAVQKANSGHPGTPMALAPVAYVLWDRFLRHNPRNTDWPNRDRFVLSNGHASMLLYSLLYLTGYPLTLDDLKHFRQWGSKTPGHPEYGLTPGAETTTGPLGQGVANSVGMAISEKWLAAHFNRENQDLLVDYRVYAICGDGDMMEGVSSEAASIAGHLGLNNLIWIYDNNRITIEGSTDLAFSEDVALRFMGYHWNILRVSDANDLGLIERAIRTAQQERTRPTLIILDSHIGWGAPKKQDTAAAHGEPLGEDEIRAAKKFYGWPEDAHFLVPPEVEQHMRKAVDRGKKWEEEWNARLAEYKKANPDLYKQWEMLQKKELPAGWDAKIQAFPPDPKGLATRESSGKVENAIAPLVPWFLGGSADLAPSTKTLIAGETDFESGHYGGRNFHWGIREHAMGSILNGMALSKLRPFGAGFLIFSDYMRAPIRLAALMELPVIYVFTHDSIGLGEDGPTHQPIEQLMSLRAIPRLIDVRPADANEVSEAWRLAMNMKNHPVFLVLSRQALPTFDRTKYASAAGLHKGAYILADCEGVPEVILIGTGSEVQLCVGAYEQLKAEGVRARVVSMPSWKTFEKQSAEYRDQVLPSAVRARVAVETGTTLGWREHVGLDGRIVARADFGASAPIKELMKEFGFTVEHVVAEARALLQEKKASTRA
ncbi:MAG: Transketolase [Candidatus Angelobacter sp.]|jgi:transketolase|nr:Transketolase [Candidatus Angelobacter sp.]